MKRNLPRRVSPIHNGENTAFARATDDLADGQKDRRRRGDMTHADRPGVRRYARKKLFDKFLFRRNGRGDRLVDIVEPALLRKKSPHAVDRAVFVIRCQHFIARVQCKRTGNDIQGNRHVLGIHKMIVMRSEVFSKPRARLCQQGSDPPPQKFDGLFLHLVLPALVIVHDRLRGRPKRTMIEEGH